MATSLFTSWTEHDAALDRLLSLTETTLLVFDRDLSALKLEQNSRILRLREFLMQDPKHRLHLAVQDASQAVARFPKLIRLHADFAHSLVWSTTSESVAHLNDSMLIADGRHALVRFHRDHARGKLIEDDADECVPYLRRFDEIVAEGETSFTARPAGL